MKWYNDKRACSGVVLSSRVRLARNFCDLPFPKKCSPEELQKVSDTVKAALEKHSCERFNYISMQNLSPAERGVLTEDHLISREFCEGALHGRTLITDENNTLAIMVNEEDHLRIQSIMPGLDIAGAFERASGADDIISRGTRIAFDEALGYLTSCPTNLGTGMRASVMLHLPAMTACGQIKPLINLMTKIGLTVRGLFGEGSEAGGCLYQISNQITLGISEADAIEKLTNAVTQVEQREKQLRETLISGGGLDFEDSVCRSYGILCHARKLSSAEFLKLWSDVRLGTECGIIRDAEGVNLSKLLVEVMPAHIIRKDAGLENSSLRDAKRAEIVREYFKG